MSLPRGMGWVGKLLERKDRLSDIAETSLGDLLACGGWGCAIDTNEHWVVKLTLDETEVIAWSYLQQFAVEHPAEAGGLARVRKIVELEPEVYDPQEHRHRSAFMIVREKMTPLPEENSEGKFEDYAKFRARGWNDRQADAFLRALERYDEQAKRYSRALLGWTKKAAAEELVAAALDLGAMHTDAVPLSESLIALFERDEWVVGDLHPGNVGWRVAKNLDGERLPAGIILTDPESLRRGEALPEDLPVLHVNAGGTR